MADLTDGPYNANCPRFLVRKNIRFGPACQIKLCPRWQKIEAGVGQGHAPFAFEHHVKACAQGMQVQHV